MEDLNVTNYTADVVKKKKKTGVIIGVAAAVLVGGSGVAYAAVPVVHNTVNMAVMSPEKYCESVYENSIDKCIKDYEPIIQAAEKITGGSMTMTVEPDSDTMSMVESYIGNEIFDKLSISIDGSRNDSSMSGALTLSADDKEVISANVLGFSESGKIYAQVPGLSDKYLYVDCNDTFGEDVGQLYKNNMKKVDPSVYSDYKDLFNKYSKKFIKVIDKGTSKLEKGVEGKAADVNYKYNQVTTVLKADDLNPFIQELAEEIKNDEKLKGLIEKTYGKKFLDEIYDEVDNTDSDHDSCKVENDITVKTLIDQEGTIRGIDFSQDEDQIGFISAKEDKNVGFELLSSNQAVISVKAEQKDDSYTGTLTVNHEEENCVIDFKDLEVVNDMYINGSVSMDLSELTDNQFKTLALSFKAVDNGQNISTDISGVGKFSFDFLTSKESKKDAEEPRDAINVKDINEYLDGVDVEAYLNEASEKLGFTYDQLETIVQGIQSMFGIDDHSQQYNDDDYDYNYDDDDFNFDDDSSIDSDSDASLDDDFSNGYVDIKQPFEDIKFVINGKEAQLPAITAEMMPEGTSDKKIAGGEFESVSNQDSTFSMSFQNPSSDEQPAYQCELFSISSTSENVNFSVNTIKVGSTIADLKMRFPDAQVNDDTTSLLISDSTTQSGTIGISIDDGVVTGITCYFM